MLGLIQPPTLMPARRRLARDPRGRLRWRRLGAARALGGMLQVRGGMLQVRGGRLLSRAGRILLACCPCGAPATCTTTRGFSLEVTSAPEIPTTCTNVNGDCWLYAFFKNWPFGYVSGNPLGTTVGTTGVTSDPYTSIEFFVFIMEGCAPPRVDYDPATGNVIDLSCDVTISCNNPTVGSWRIDAGGPFGGWYITGTGAMPTSFSVSFDVDGGGSEADCTKVWLANIGTGSTDRSGWAFTLNLL